MRHLDRVLIVVNPAARNGQAAHVAGTVKELLASIDAVTSFEFAFTEAPGHATKLAQEASERGFSAVIALGGDGLIHEVVCGLMEIHKNARPALGLIPCGNGNDYARTLGMSLNPSKSVLQLASCKPRPTDVGMCNDVPFMQTLSFGLDAAIAIGTHKRRERTGQSGTKLFLYEGFAQLAFHRDIYDYSCSFDGQPEKQGKMLMFAVQVGPTYGGGFKICPHADATDGRFDVCVARPPLSLPKSAFLFLSVKEGKHLRHVGDSLLMETPERLRLTFSVVPPAQIDGEPIQGTSFDIRTAPAALTVLFANET